jgi:hypothetical protein
MLHAIQRTDTPSAVNDAAPTTGPAAPAAPSQATLLPQPSPLMGGDIGAEIAALAVKAGLEQNKINSTAASAQDRMEDAANAAQVADLHAEASTMRSGAWMSGVLQMSAGACTIASAGLTLGQPTTPTGGTTTAAQQASMHDWSAAILTAKGVGEGFEAGSSLAGGLSKAAATDTEALATQEKALADAAQRSGSDARTAEQSATQFVQSAIDFYKEYEATKAQTQAAALHGA